MRFISLFAGIGGMDLGLERAGWECVAQVEWDDYCNKILEKHWPDVPRWRDIHDVSPEDLPDCDAIVGGFPCQPVSLAGNRLAQDDPRWLWPEFFRIVYQVRPSIVVVENVPGLASAGMGDVLGDLASIGYDAEWQSIPAAAVGAPHLRWRIFIVAYPERSGLERTNGQIRAAFSARQTVRRPGEDRPSFGDGPEPSGVAYGVPNRVDRLRGLGNAVVPQVAEWIGLMISRAYGV